MKFHISHHKLIKQKRFFISFFIAVIFHGAIFIIFLFIKHEPKKIKKDDNKIFLSLQIKKNQESENVEIKKESNQLKQKPQPKAKKLLDKKEVTNDLIKKEAQVEKDISQVPIQNQAVTENVDELKNFLPSGQVLSQWREEGASSSENPSAFVKSVNTFDKSYPHVLDFSEQIKFNYIRIPDILRKVFNTENTKIKVTKKSDGTWEISSIYSKNPYFRAYFYEEFKKLLLDPSILNSLKKTELSSFLFTFNYLKTKSYNESVINIKSQVSKNIISFSITESVQPEEYTMFAPGGLNIIGTALYAYDKAFPDEYKKSPLFIELRKSKAFSYEGVIRD